MFEQDYLLRQITMMTKVLLKIFFKLDIGETMDVEFEDAETLALHNEILSLADRGQICQAEDRLFEVLEKNPSDENLKTALLFYDHLIKKDESFLEENDFSRKEIESGINDCIKLYGLEEEVDKIVPKINPY